MKQIIIAFKVLLIFTLLTGVLYPLAMTGIGKIAFGKKSEGSIIYVKNNAAGSKLIGQEFTSARYFHGRPSASSYNGLSSGGSNYSPANKEFLKNVAKRSDLVRKENALAPDAKIPSDIVLASASGLDPHLSIDAVQLQIPRVAKERGLKESDIYAIVNRCTEKKYFYLFGTRITNILMLNRALDTEKGND